MRRSLSSVNSRPVLLIVGAWLGRVASFDGFGHSLLLSVGIIFPLRFDSCLGCLP